MEVTILGAQKNVHELRDRFDADVHDRAWAADPSTPTGKNLLALRGNDHLGHQTTAAINSNSSTEEEAAAPNFGCFSLWVEALHRNSVIQLLPDSSRPSSQKYLKALTVHKVFDGDNPQVQEGRAGRTTRTNYRDLAGGGGGR